MNKDRIRNRHNRRSKRVFLIAYEGNNKTEKNYFYNFLSREKNFVIKIVPGNETDPINLIKQTINKVKEIDLDFNNGDLAYCVFDTDTDTSKNNQIIKAVSLALKNNVIPIISSPCIELWFLLHYEYTTGFISNEEVINILKRHNSKYKKNYNIYLDIKDRTNVAIDNSKKLENYHLKNKKKLQLVDTNPYTEIYKIVEELIK